VRAWLQCRHACVCFRSVDVCLSSMHAVMVCVCLLQTLRGSLLSSGACARQQKWLVWAFCIKGGDLNCVLFLGGRRPKISPACFLAHANYKSRGTFAPGCEVVGILSLLIENLAFGGISHHAARPAQAINEEWFGASRRMDVEIRG